MSQTCYVTIQATKRLRPPSQVASALVLLRITAPHDGHSSQLFVDHNHRSAQFLPAVGRSAITASSSDPGHWCVKHGPVAVCNRQKSLISCKRGSSLKKRYNLSKSMLCTSDPSSNFFLRPTSEMLGLFYQLRKRSNPTQRVGLAVS